MNCAKDNVVFCFRAPRGRGAHPPLPYPPPCARFACASALCAEGFSPTTLIFYPATLDFWKMPDINFAPRVNQFLARMTKIGQICNALFGEAIVT